MKENFGEYIRLLRVSNNITLTKLAAALDLDQSTLSKIETMKRNAPEEVLPKLSSIFNLDIKMLEKEFFSEKIATIIYKIENSTEILKLAEEKAKNLKIKKTKQSTIQFK